MTTNTGWVGAVAVFVGMLCSIPIMLFCYICFTGTPWKFWKKDRDGE